MISSESKIETKDARHWPRRWELVFLAVFTVLYGIKVVRNAAVRPLWLDEIVTVRLSNLPTFNDVWAALAAGADTAPPGVYLLTRISCALGGAGRLPARLPAILGYWCMSIGIFYFVKRWAGSTLAAFSILFLATTIAINYATEARGYAPLLGALAISMVSWQIATTTPGRHALSLAALAISTDWPYPSITTRLSFIYRCSWLNSCEPCVCARSSGPSGLLSSLG